MPDAMAQYIGLFGGSFDPIHHGHLIVARAVAEQVGLDRILLLPSATPPHKRAEALIAPHHRAEMVRLAIRDEPLFDLSDHDLARTGPTYTVQTVSFFRQQLGPTVRLAWIIGADSLAELHTWYQVADLADACDLLTAARPGWERPDLSVLKAAIGPQRLARIEARILSTPRIDISSTDIRARVRAGRSVRYLVPAPVADYMERHHLYAD